MQGKSPIILYWFRRVRNMIGQSDNSGQMMIEVIVALALITLFLSAIAVIELIAVKNVEFTQNKSIATRLAQQQIERARVVRDVGGIGALTAQCKDSPPCYINNLLTPVPITEAPVGIYQQSLTIYQATSSDCPPQAVTPPTPTPVYYKALSVVSWAQGAVITPVPQVQLSSCITDWR